MTPRRAAWLATAALAGIAAGPASAQALSADEAAALRAQVASLKAQLAAMEQRLDQVTGVTPATAAPPAPPIIALPVTGPATATAKPATSIAWKGSPQFSSDGMSFKVKGRIQADAGYVSTAGTGDRGLGFSTEMRRIRLGGEGAMTGGFAYKLELELSDNAVDLVDTFVTWSNSRWLVTAGNHNSFQSLDELVGDTTGSTMERAAFTDAFGFERRMGLSAQYRRGPWLAQAGVFSDDIGALSNDNDGPQGGDENNSFSLDQRLVFAPKVGDVQLHIGGSYHWRNLKRVADTPSLYRQRPYLHSSNTRILSTPSMDVDREIHYGVEAAAVAGPWHMASEAHWLRASRPGLADPTFFGAYGEIGYFLTGESRAYGDGIFGRTRPRKRLGEGGVGALQANLRYDYLDLNDGPVRGGRQRGVIGAFIWTPIDYLRVNLNYAVMDYDGASVLSRGRDRYRIQVAGARIELDF